MVEDKELQPDAEKLQVEEISEQATAGSESNQVDPEPEIPSESNNSESLETVEAFSEAQCQLLSNGLVKIPVAKKGEFFHKRYGKVSFTDQDFEDIVRNYEENVLGFTPYATYGHLIDPSLSVDAELKKGTSKGFEIEDGVLYAVTEPTIDTLELITKGEYEYASGEFIRNFEDKETGENKGTVLMRYALTNSPFIPFKDKKIEVVETLSENAKRECTHSVINFMLKLSTDSGNSENSIPEVDSTPTSLEVMSDQINTQELETPVVESTDSADQTQPVTQESSMEDKAQETIPTPAVESTASVVDAAPAAAPAAPAFDVNELVKQVVAQVTAAYQAQLDAVKQSAEATIASLKSEITSLNGQLTDQSATVQAFSNSMSVAQKAFRYQAIAAQGVPAALIERFSQIESALKGGSQVIKLSTEAGEAELALDEVISQLLIDAVQAEPVRVEQFGQSVSTVDANGFVSDMKRLISVNQEAAKKLSL